MDFLYLRAGFYVVRFFDAMLRTQTAFHILIDSMIAVRLHGFIIQSMTIPYQWILQGITCAAEFVWL